jgi:DNA modification methylase
MGRLILKSKHRLLCGDSTSSDDVRRLMNDELADMVFTSPPYNANINSEAKIKRIKYLYLNSELDNKSKEEYLDFNNTILSIIYDFTMENSQVFYNINYNKNSKSDYINVIHNSLEKFNLTETIIWEKTMTMSLSGENMTRIYEFIFMLSKGAGLKWKKDVHECVKNLWKISNINSQIKENQACFPVELVEKAIGLMDCHLLYEPFCGSGSTLIACDRKNICCYGMEIYPAYCDVIVERYRKNCNKKVIKESE